MERKYICKIKASHTMPEKEMEEEFDYWNDNEFIEELDRRSNDYSNGNIKGVPWEEAKARILSSKGEDKKENS
jgi:putative addiction module component (TIGR02574 family)